MTQIRANVQLSATVSARIEKDTVFLVYESQECKGLRATFDLSAAEMERLAAAWLAARGMEILPDEEVTALAAIWLGEQDDLQDDL